MSSEPEQKLEQKQDLSSTEREEVHSWSYRRRVAPRSRSIATKSLSREEIQVGATLALDDAEPTSRPRTRGDCRYGPRPCPWVSCRHHLYLDVNPRTGTLKINFPHLDLSDMPETCALDAADRGGLTLDTIGQLMNLTRERVRQMERVALLGARCTAVENRLDRDRGQ
jgi:hypothetical protein